jgi:hypothetical protein
LLSVTAFRGSLRSPAFHYPVRDLHRRARIGATRSTTDARTGTNPGTGTCAHTRGGSTVNRSTVTSN